MTVTEMVCGIASGLVYSVWRCLYLCQCTNWAIVHFNFSCFDLFPSWHHFSQFLAKHDVLLVDDVCFIYYIFPILRLLGGVGNQGISQSLGLVQEDCSQTDFTEGEIFTTYSFQPEPLCS